MGDHWLFKFRWRCRAIVPGSEVPIWSLKNADRIVDNGVIAGHEFREIAITLCHRWRWHRGECR